MTVERKRGIRHTGRKRKESRNTRNVTEGERRKKKKMGVWREGQRDTNRLQSAKEK